MAGTVPTISITNPDMESENLALTAPNTPDSPTVFDIVKTIDHKDWETEAPLSLDDGTDVAKDLEVANGDDNMDSDDSDDLERIETIEYGRNSVESDEDPEQQPKAHATADIGRTTPTQASTIDSRKIPDSVSHDEEGSSFVALSQFYNEKSILITGVTGFIGKAVLWKLLKSLHEPIEKIFVLIRPSGTHRKSTSRPSDRLHQEVLSNKVSNWINLQNGEVSIHSPLDHT
jgi:Male sterility protein